MDIDDGTTCPTDLFLLQTTYNSPLSPDQVEKVSRVPSTNASSNEFDDDDGGDASPGIQDEDVSMDEDAPKAKAKRGPRKPKAVIPVGRNGLKKKKVTKTRRMKDANGYTGTCSSCNLNLC